MSTEQQREELQRRIAEAKGWTDLRNAKLQTRFVPTPLVLAGLDPSDGLETVVPGWPWDISDAWELVEEMKADPKFRGYQLRDLADGTVTADRYGMELLVGAPRPFGWGATEAEAICRCWCAWKGIDASDIGG